jgi:hypothetical protein
MDIPRWVRTTLHAWGEIHERSTVTLLSDKNFATEVAPSFLPQ